MKPIEINIDHSVALGFVSTIDCGHLKSYLAELLEPDVQALFIDWLLSQKIYDLCILKNLEINRDDRGQGLGNNLLSNFLKRSHNIPVILICDSLEIQSPGFDLESWYIRKGFLPTPFKTLSGKILIRV